MSQVTLGVWFASHSSHQKRWTSIIQYGGHSRPLQELGLWVGTLNLIPFLCTIATCNYQNMKLPMNACPFSMNSKADRQRCPPTHPASLVSLELDLSQQPQGPSPPLFLFIPSSVCSPDSPNTTPKTTSHLGTSVVRIRLPFQTVLGEEREGII